MPVYSIATNPSITYTQQTAFMDPRWSTNGDNMGPFGTLLLTSSKNGSNITDMRLSPGTITWRGSVYDDSLNPIATDAILTHQCSIKGAVAPGTSTWTDLGTGFSTPPTITGQGVVNFFKVECSLLVNGSGLNVHHPTITAPNVLSPITVTWREKWYNTSTGQQQGTGQATVDLYQLGGAIKETLSITAPPVVNLESDMKVTVPVTLTGRVVGSNLANPNASGTDRAFITLEQLDSNIGLTLTDKTGKKTRLIPNQIKKLDFPTTGKIDLVFLLDQITEYDEKSTQIRIGATIH